MKTIVERVAWGNEMFVRELTALQSPFLLAVRVYWGCLFVETGWGKLTNLEKVAGFFESLRIPWPYLGACLAGLSECVGGALLLAGLLSRPAALSLVFTMLVAYATADREALVEIFSDPEKFYQADPFSFLMAALLVLLFGSGLFSADAWVGWWHKKRRRGG